MKIIALVLAAASTLSFALIYLKSFGEKLAAVQSVIEFLRGINRALSVEPAPMQEMFHSLAERSAGRECEIFRHISGDLDLLGEKSFYKIWCDNIAFFYPELLQNERNELTNIGASLGICPVDMQIKHISDCEVFFADILQSDRARYPQIKKLSIGLSSAAAAAIIIVFI